MTFGASRARKADFGSLEIGGAVHALYRAKRAAVGYSCTLQRRRTRNDRRTQHRSPLRKTGAGLGLSDLEAGPSLTLLYTPRLGGYGTN